jgi:hypothetical protein
MSTLNIPFTYNWAVRTPTVIRVMGRQYVDDFFNEGHLRISSFDAFRKHPDEARRDEEEGRASMLITSSESRMTAIAFNGQEAYVLCASTVEQPIDRDSSAGIRINDTVAFPAAVSRQLPGFVGGTEGSCIYRESTIYEAKNQRSFTPPKEGEDPEDWADRSDRILGEHMQNKFFIKPLKFFKESEYRMIWFCNGKPRDFIDITCKDAVRFCERA